MPYGLAKVSGTSNRPGAPLHLEGEAVHAVLADARRLHVTFTLSRPVGGDLARGGLEP
jgi:hypothetical protein